jgi:hypothetical protein
MKSPTAIGRSAVACSLLSFVLVMTMVGEASAQQRSGLVGGFSLGGGVLALGGSSTDPVVGIIQDDEGTVGAVAVDLHLGFMVRPRVAFLFEGAAAGDQPKTSLAAGQVTVGSRQVTFNSSTTSLMSMVLAGAIQYWITERVWVRGGVGAGWLHRDLVIDAQQLSITLEKSAAPTTLVAAGADVWRRANFALDLEFHFTTFAKDGLRISAPTMQVGFQWY